NGEPGEPFDLLRLMPCRQIVEAVCAEQQHELMAGQPALDRPQRLDRVRRPGTARLEVGYLERGIAAHGELRHREPPREWTLRTIALVRWIGGGHEPHPLEAELIARTL